MVPELEKAAIEVSELLVIVDRDKEVAAVAAQSIKAEEDEV